MGCGVYTLKWKLYLQIPKFYRERLQLRGIYQLYRSSSRNQVSNQWLWGASELLCPPSYGLMRYGGAVRVLGL